MSHPLIKALQPGFNYFPLARGSKKPALAENWRELSTTQLDLIKGWVLNGYNLGVDCEKSSLLVVDVDGPEGAASWAAMSNVQDGYESLLEVKTPHGRHIYFHGSVPSSVSRIAPKVDIRSRGGYVVAPGSTVDGVEYVIER
jgi:hypothetical protein